MVVQTLLQISPAQVLDPTKEQFTACSLSVPTSSMSAMFTIMKNINYISANMESYFSEIPGGMSSRRLEKQPMRSSSAYPTDRIEFDIGDTLQAIGDSLSGSAAQVGVDLVLYHGDVSLKHVNVYGDEASLRYAITQVRVSTGCVLLLDRLIRVHWKRLFNKFLTLPSGEIRSSLACFSPQFQ
jgi:osomolarity two-component system response regulator SSK1